MPTIGAAYIRVSTDDQVEYSPASQLEKIREYAAAHDILVPDEFVFRDEGISGRTTDKRPEFNRMIGTAKTKPKPFDVILLWKFSRFARSREDSILYKSMLRRQLGIDVISISEPVGDDKMSVIVEAMIEAMDEYYSINLAEEVRRGMSQRARKGKHNSYAPLGYQMQDGKLIPDPETAPIVRRIFSDFVGGKPMLTIARELGALGVRTRMGNPYDSRDVKYILQNLTYIGTTHWNPNGREPRDSDDAPDAIHVENAHEPLIDRATFDAAVAKINAARTRGKYERTDGKKFALKGLVKCSCCGSTLTLTGRKDSMLQCVKYSKGICPESHGINITKLTAAVLDQIQLDFETLDFAVDQGGPVHAPTGEDELTQRQITRETAKLKRIRDAYEDGVYTLAEYRERREATEQALADLRKKLTTPAPKKITAKAFAARHKGDLQRAMSKNSTPEEQNTALKAFVRRIVFDRKNNAFVVQYANNAV